MDFCNYTTYFQYSVIGPEGYILFTIVMITNMDRADMRGYNAQMSYLRRSLARDTLYCSSSEQSMKALVTKCLGMKFNRLHRNVANEIRAKTLVWECLLCA